MKNDLIKRIVCTLAALALLASLSLPAFAEGSYVCGCEAHTHGDACYTSQLVCGLEETAPAEGAEGEAAGHQHGEACYAPVLCCTLPEHTHTDACLPAPTPAPAVAAEPAPAPTAEPAKTAAPAGDEAPEADAAEDADAPEASEAPAAPEEAEETEETGDAIEIEEEDTPLDIRIVKLYEDAQVRITVTYDDESLPAEAQLVARPITAESDPEAYAALLAQAGQALGAEDAAAIPMLFYDIRFYVGSEEVEPTAPVEVKVQFLANTSFQVDDEMAVLHLDENGAETLDREVAVDENTTTFQA